MSEQRGPTGAAARRERGRREMIADIIDAAERIVADEGVEALTIRAVAKTLGYSPGALYEYFDSKEAILCALYFQGTGGLDACCVELAAQLPEDVDASDAIVRLGRAYRDYALEHAEMYRLAFCGVQAPPVLPDVTDPDDQAGSFGVLTGLVRRGIAQGAIVNMPASDVAFAAWSAVHGFVLLELTDHIAGSTTPGAPAASPDASRRQRDHQFEALLRIIQYGIVTRGRITSTSDTT